MLVVKKPHDPRTTHAASEIIRYAVSLSRLSISLTVSCGRYLSSSEFGRPKVIVERNAVPDLAELGIYPNEGDVQIDVLDTPEVPTPTGT